MSNEKQVVMKMKELWTYWRAGFEDYSRDIKDLLKTKKYGEYEKIVYRILM